MKKKIIFALALAGMLLTACSSGGGVSDEISAGNPAESGVTETLETEPSETETSAATTEESPEETAETETAVIAGSTSSDYFDYFTFDLGRFEVDMEDYPSALVKPDFHKECRLLSKNILCTVYQLEGDDGAVSYLRFYDIDKGELAAEIPLPDGSNFSAYSCENGGENVLVKVYTVKYSDTVSYGEVTVYKDYSYDIVDDGTTPYPGIDYYNTGVYGSEPGTADLVNLRTNATLVEDGENGLALFGASIDENRFAFLKREYDVGTYIGIYDYETGGITEIPDSNVLGIIGYYNGKIYAYNTNTAEWHMEGCVGEIYSFDVQTLEKKVFMTFHTPGDAEGQILCFMEQDKGYMAAALSYTGWSNSEETAYVISLDSGEIVAKHESGEYDWEKYGDDGYIRGITCADGRVALINSGTDKLLVLDTK
ncbi:MAG: hypothetical protein NC253_10350 [Ruminococcus sp.]|nr:hypothetical protein [Ruminococcus sp.]MCM1380717.1 hypothetical protein [Muribaculaceae bacterium]MCM1479781.1 hypothetical protein [Muribaculaceae bacterium]